MRIIQTDRGNLPEGVYESKGATAILAEVDASPDERDILIAITAESASIANRLYTLIIGRNIHPLRAATTEEINEHASVLEICADLLKR